MKLLKILVIVALVLFPFGELLRFEMGNNIAVRPLDVVVGLAAVIFLFRKIKKSHPELVSGSNKVYEMLKRVQHDIHWSIVLFSLVALVSLLTNLMWLEPKELVVSSFYLLRWVAYAALAGIVWQFDEKFKKKLILFLFIDALIMVLAGFVQYFFFNHLKSLYHLGWDEHKHRIFSVFFDPNFAGAFFVLFFLFVGGMLYREVKMGKVGKKWKIRGMGIVLVLTLVAIFMTFSRGALLSLIAGSTIFFILIKRIRLLMVLLGLMALFVAIVSPQFYDENMNLFRTASSKARIGNYEVALRLIQDRPILGVGFNAYRYAKEEYGVQMGWVKAPSHADAGVDNSFLFVLATTGFVGFIAYCSLLVVIARRAYVLHKKGSILATVFIASGVALCINAMFINSLFFAPLMFWMWMMVGLMEGLGSRG